MLDNRQVARRLAEESRRLERRRRRRRSGRMRHGDVMLGGRAVADAVVFAVGGRVLLCGRSGQRQGRDRGRERGRIDRRQHVLSVEFDGGHARALA